MSYVEDREEPSRVRGFVGCGHAWRISCWKKIKPYPEWFVFYGEEDFAAFELFKKKLQIHYVPCLFVHHRVNVKARKKDRDYYKRARRSLRSGWMLWIMFLPYKNIVRLFFSSIFGQLKGKVFKGEIAALASMSLALFDTMRFLPKCFSLSNRLTVEEYQKIKALPATKIYWKYE